VKRAENDGAGEIPPFFYLLHLFLRRAKIERNYHPVPERHDKVACLLAHKETMTIDLVRKYQTHKKDTGSAEVQVVLLTEKIKELAKHLKKHAKDSDSRRGLLIMVGKRRRLLNYLKKINPKIYEKLIKDLGLKK